MSSLTDF